MTVLWTQFLILINISNPINEIVKRFVYRGKCIFYLNVYTASDLNSSKIGLVTTL